MIVEKVTIFPEMGALEEHIKLAENYKKRLYKAKRNYNDNDKILDELYKEPMFHFSYNHGKCELIIGIETSVNLAAKKGINFAIRSLKERWNNPAEK